MPSRVEMVDILNINLERDLHLSEAHRLVQRLRPEVLLLQELSERSLRRFASDFQPCSWHYARMGRHPADDGGEPVMVGTAFLSRLPTVGAIESHYYCGSARGALVDPVHSKFQNHPLVVGTVRKGAAFCNIGTTHAPWAPDGNATDAQRTAIERLLQLVSRWRDFALIGDMNAPRPHEIYQMLIKYFKDNIPADVESTIDPSLHREGHWLRTVIDYVFTTRAYEVSRLELISGISDHMTIWVKITNTV